MQPTQKDARPRARSPFAAAFLSLIFPGLGHAYAGAFVRAGLVDRVVAYLAPVLLGDGVAALSGTGIGTLADGVALDVLHTRRCGWRATCAVPAPAPVWR